MGLTMQDAHKRNLAFSLEGKVPTSSKSKKSKREVLWRNQAVEVLQEPGDDNHITIMTPCGWRMKVPASETTPIDRKRRPRAVNRWS